MFCLDEGEKTKHDSMYDAFPNVAKKRKPSRQEVTDFAHLPTGDLSHISHPIESCFAAFCFLTLLGSQPKTVNKCFLKAKL